MDWIALIVALLALVLGIVLAVRGAARAHKADEALARTEKLATQARDALRSASGAVHDSDLALKESAAATRQSEDAVKESVRVLAESTAALERSTNALERASTLASLPARERPATAAVEPPRPSLPWKLSTKGNRFSFRNDGDDVLLAVALEQTNGNDLTAQQEMPVGELAPGEEIVFTAAWKYNSPPTAQVLITWRIGEGPILEHRATLV